MFGLKNPLRKRQFIGLLIGIGLGIIIYVLLPLKKTESFLSLGPMNTGHEDLSCNACHYDAPGNLAEQVVSNTQHAFGLRKKGVDFGTQNVDNKKCLDCHQRPNDRHPTHRFLEPGHKKAIKIINATECETCHREHSGVRIVLNDAAYCVNCHADLKVKKDPLDVPHKVLIENKQWNTCLQCHDFHGNHIYKLPTAMKDTIPIYKIMEYIKGGADPFTDEKKYYPLSEAAWKEKHNYK